MVKRYEGSHIAEMNVGSLVRHADYLALQAALREALNQWDSWNHSELEGTQGWLGEGREHDTRIRKLRAQFLDDK